MSRHSRTSHRRRSHDQWWPLAPLRYKGTNMMSFKQRTGYLLSTVRAAMRGRMDAALADKGLTTPQYTALTTLEEDPGLSNADMARLCFVTPQTMVPIIEDLERAGLVG